MLRVLQHLQKAGFVLNGQDVTPAVASVMERLTRLGLVEPGYEGDARGEPSLWVGNANGSRVLRSFTTSPDRLAALESRLEVHARARTALTALTEWEQAKVLAAAEALQGREPATWAKEEAVPLPDQKQVYLLRVSPEMRAFVRVRVPGRIELSDLVREETLKLFTERR
jgi:hypothetical protein